MAKYLLLYSGGRMPETDQEMAQVMKAWEGWFSELGPAVADQGNPFTPAVKKISSDGSVAEAAPTASGYSILEADSLDRAAELAKGCPVLQGGAAITIFETFEVM
jgi:YCII-related domain